MKSVCFLMLVCILLAFNSQASADQFSPKENPIYVAHGTAPMRPCEVGETLPPDQRPKGYCGHPYVTKYFDLNDPQDLELRDSFRVSIIDGVVYQSQPPHAVYPDSEMFFVMDSSGNFYLFAKTGEAPLHHSSFFDGQPIAAGGEMNIAGGKIVNLTTKTGHYQMTGEVFQNALDALKDDGVDLTPEMIHILPNRH